MSLRASPRLEAAWQALSPAQRAGRLAAGLGWPLVMAAAPLWLQSGVGPGCAFRALTGLPCPLCGGTRACAAVAQGDWAGAWAANPGALGVLALASLWALQWAVEGAAGVRRARPLPWEGAGAVRAVLAGLLAAWAAALAGLR